MLPDLETPDEDLLDDTEDEIDVLDDFADLEDEDDGEVEESDEEPEPRSRAELDHESLRIRGFFDSEYRG